MMSRAGLLLIYCFILARLIGKEEENRPETHVIKGLAAVKLSTAVPLIESQRTGGILSPSSLLSLLELHSNFSFFNDEWSSIKRDRMKG